MLQRRTLRDDESFSLKRNVPSKLLQAIWIMMKCLGEQHFSGRHCREGKGSIIYFGEYIVCQQRLSGREIKLHAAKEDVAWWWIVFRKTQRPLQSVASDLNYDEMFGWATFFRETLLGREFFWRIYLRHYWCFHQQSFYKYVYCPMAPTFLNIFRLLRWCINLNTIE